MWWYVAAAAVSMIAKQSAADKQAKAMRKSNYDSLLLRNQQVDDTLRQGREQAMVIRDQAISKKAQAAAISASQGFVVGTGSMQSLQETIDSNASADALVTLKNAEQSADYQSKGIAIDSAISRNQQSALKNGTNAQLIGDAVNVGVNSYLLDSKGA